MQMGFARFFGTSTFQFSVAVCSPHDLGSSNESHESKTHEVACADTDSSHCIRGGDQWFEEQASQKASLMLFLVLFALRSQRTEISGDGRFAVHGLPRQQCVQWSETKTLHHDGIEEESNRR